MVEPFGTDPAGRPVPPGPGDEPGLKIGRLVLLCLGVGAALYLVASLIWSGPDNSGDPGAVPLIRADSSPARIAPDDPGGKDIPDQDKLIYGRLSGDSTEAPEQLLPPPAEPLPRPAVPPPPPAAPPAAVQPAPPPAPPPPQAKAPPPSPPPPPAQPPAATRPPVAVKPPVPVKPPAAPAKPAPPAKPPATAPGSAAALIQLAALSDKAAAERAWTKLAKAHSDLLAGLSPVYQEVTVNGKTLWRLRASGFQSRDQATEICAKLKQRAQDCNVVR